jgi:uncharacterized membrane protein YdjX (TVP38/TMEM64 family)
MGEEQQSGIARNERSALRGRFATIGAVAVVVAALIVLWVATPLREWIDVTRAVALMRRLGDSPFAPLVMIGAYVLGGLLVFPVNILIAVTVIVFGPLPGIAYALVGCLLSAVVLYELGRLLPSAGLRGRSAERIRLLGKQLAGHGVLAVMLVRIVPVAPYSVVSLVGGVVQVQRPAYLLGTALGMLPGILVNALFIDRILAAIHSPGPLTIALVVLAAAVIVAFAFAVRRHLARTNVAE